MQICNSTLQLHIIYLYIQNCLLLYTSCTYNCQFYIVIPYLLVLFNSSFYYLCFCSVTVILLHCDSFCHENKLLVSVNIPGNKAHSDSLHLLLRWRSRQCCGRSRQWLPQRNQQQHPASILHHFPAQRIHAPIPHSWHEPWLPLQRQAWLWLW